MTHLAGLANVLIRQLPCLTLAASLAFFFFQHTMKQCSWLGKGREQHTAADCVQPGSDNPTSFSVGFEIENRTLGEP